jgi:Domain of unknown function (DUF4397)
MMVRTTRPDSLRRLLSAVFCCGFAALACLLAATPALAATQPNGLLRVAYFSPDGPAVDVYVDGGRILTNVVYKTVGTYQSLPAGGHRVEFRQTGSAAGSPALASASTTLSPGAYYTAAALGKVAQLTAVVFNDGFTPPVAGKAELRALHFAPEVPAVDIAIKGGPVIFSSVGFPEATSYAAVAGGSYDLEFRAAGTDQVLLTARGVTIKAGAVESLVGVGGVGRPIEVVQVQDAAAAAVAMAGGAEGAGGGGGAGTGMGGMAPPDLAGMLQLGLVLAVFGTLLWVVKRRTGGER